MSGSGLLTTIGGNFQINGNTQIGDAGADTLVVFSDTFAFKDNSALKTINANLTAVSPGVNLAVTAGATSLATGDGGNLLLTGGATSGTIGSADGGKVNVTGGASTGVGGGRGGNVEITTGASAFSPAGDWIATIGSSAVPGVAAVNLFASGTVPASITINQATGTTIFNATVRPSTDTTAGSSLGTSSFGWGAVFFRNVADSGTVDIRASGAGVDGALGVGVDNTGHIFATALNVSDAISQLDAAIMGGGGITFTAGAAIDSGTFVRISSNDNVQMTLATSSAGSDAVGNAETAALITASVTVTTTFGGLIENARLVNGLTPSAGDHVFLSDATAGRGTTVAPTTSGSYIKPVGPIKDASAYVTVTNPFVELIFQPGPATLIA
jgi:hypothetical protein